jgi:hypothetical protein
MLQAILYGAERRQRAHNGGYAILGRPQVSNMQIAALPDATSPEINPEQIEAYQNDHEETLFPDEQHCRRHRFYVDAGFRGQI